MKSRNRMDKVKLFCCVASVLTLLIWLHSLYMADGINKLHRTVSIRIQGMGVDAGSLDRAVADEMEKKQDVPEVTAWNPGGSKTVANRNLMRKTKIPVIHVRGDMQSAAPVTLAAGSYAYAEDEEGCVIDTESAWLLFGTVDVAGNPVMIEEERYLVRGVVRSDQPVIMIQDTRDTARFTNLELKYQDAEWGQKHGEEFIYQNGLAEQYTIIDGRFCGKLMNWMVRLPLWIAVIILMVPWGIKKCFAAGNRFGKSKGLEPYTGFLLTALFCILLTGFLVRFWSSPLYIPARWIPDKWSDFEYWSRLCRTIGEEWRTIRYLNPNLKDVVLVDSMKQCFWETALISLYLITASIFRRAGKDSKREACL